MQVKLTKTQKIKVLNSIDIFTVMRTVLLRENKIDRNKEHFWTVGLDNADRVLYVELISLGTSRSVQVEPMQVFRVAVLKGAVKMILVHNHPSGNIRPSKEDIDLTDRLLQVGYILGIEVTDHLIISENAYNSLKDTEVLAQIEESEKYIPTYKIKAKVQKEAESIGKQKRNNEIVKLMVKKKLTPKQIAELTGLTVKEINAILPKSKTKPKA